MKMIRPILSPRSRHVRSIAVAVGMLVTVAATWLFAHEGHAPLPTKGVAIDAEKGTVTLSPNARGILDVHTADAKPRVAEEKVLAYATLVSPWQQHAFVSTRLPGRIVNLFANPGQTVTKGQVLAEVQGLELEDLQLDLLNLQAAASLAAKVKDQAKSLAAIGTIAERDHLEAVAKYRQAANALDIAKVKWSSLGLGADKLDQLLREKNPRLMTSLPVASPISGTLIHADVALGRVVDPTEHLVEVMDLSTVWVKIGVLERDLHRVKVGQPVELTLSAFPNEPIPATVQIKSLFLDPVTHLGTVWAELKNDPGKDQRFLPGMHGQAHIVMASSKVFLTAPDRRSQLT